MTTYFVRTSGNDSTGTGATGAPWLTISKALTVMVAGDVLNIGTGTYAENSSSTGRLQFVTAYASTTTFQTETGLQDVTITGASDATINTIFNSGVSNVTCTNLTFAMRVNTNAHAVRLAQTGAGIIFNTCKFVVTTNSGTVNAALYFQPSGAVSVSATFNTCSFTCVGTDNARGTQVVWTASNTITATFNTCTSVMTGDSMYHNGGTYTITGGSYRSNNASAAHCLAFGIDSNTGGNATTVTLSRASIVYAGTLGHGLLLGNGCASCDVGNCYISGEDSCLVLKEHTGTVVHDCVLYTGSQTAAYFKAATSCTVTRCDIFVDQGVAAGTSGCKVGVGDTGNKNLNNTFTNNTVHLIHPAASAYKWDGVAADSGGGVSDYNTFVTSSPQTGGLGVVCGSAACTTLADVITAWSTYSVTTNDSHSAFSPTAILADYSRFPV